MINLFIGLILICTSLGATISKTTKEFGLKKQRQHIKPLILDKEFKA